MRQLLPWFGRLVTPELLAHIRRAAHPESLRNPALGHRRPHPQQFRQRNLPHIAAWPSLDSRVLADARYFRGAGGNWRSQVRLKA